MPNTFGQIVRDARLAAGLSLRALGAHVGVSAPYLYDVEQGRRRLAPRHWRGLMAAVPALSFRALAESALASGPVQIDARDLTDEQRATLVAALEGQARAA